MTKRAITIAVLLLIGLGFWAATALDLSLEGLRDLVAQAALYRDQNAGLLWTIYFLAYVAVTALSLPLAVWMTLGAGAIFGFWSALLMVSFAASIGATLAFLAARYVARDWVMARFGARLEGVNRGLARDGAFYLFTLRLVPIVPFFVVNLVMGLSPMKVLTFYLVSQAGMFAGTTVYVNAGTQLAGISALGDIVSPMLLASFAALGIFPWLAKFAVAQIRRHRAYRGDHRPARFDRNLIVIGAGAAGLVSAYIAAAVKAKVTLVEAGEMGGDCLNFGCVPSKALIKSAKRAHDIRTAEKYGINAPAPQVDFPRVMARVHEVIAQIAPHDSVERYEGLGVEVIKGYARLRDPWHVDITRADGTVTTLSTRAIIIATGAAPAIPPIKGLQDVPYLTSDTLWAEMKSRPSAPKSMVILGGGPIGCELAQSFARLGVQITQVEMADRVLAREDAEVSAALAAALTQDGVTLKTAMRAVACAKSGDQIAVTLEGKAGRETILADDLLIAVGRTPRLSGFGLEELGIVTAPKVETNDYLQTLLPNILAAGDVAGPYQFTHTAAHEAYYAAVNALFGDIWASKADYRTIPFAIFTDPEIARVGLSETEARAKGIAYEVTRYDLDDLDRAIADGTTTGFVKVLTAKGSDRILGATIMGAEAGNLLAEFTLAMKHGLGLQKILGTIHVYPTMAEANKYVAGNWRKARVNARALALLSRFHGWRRGAE
ncbi:FAD-dependent oxidoreductase [Rhodobacteraceae bacterium XHP0102]|nr:FAD-dependent oxidoreductase [Rhodobacteraceae bacterium XHP0102]